MSLRNIHCIIPWVQPVSSMTCNDPAHEEWFHKYSQHFIQLSYSGVRRFIRCQQAVGDGHPVMNQGAPQLSVMQQLPALQVTPGNEVIHTFQAQSVYCLQYILWCYPLTLIKCHCHSVMWWWSLLNLILISIKRQWKWSDIENNFIGFQQIFNGIPMLPISIWQQ